MCPEDVGAYLVRKLEELPITERMKLHSELLKRAEEMWNGFCLWVGDAAEARLELQHNPEVNAWLQAGER